MAGRHALRRSRRARLAAAWRAFKAAHVEAPETCMVAWALLVLAVLVVGEAL